MDDARRRQRELGEFRPLGDGDPPGVAPHWLRKSTNCITEPIKSVTSRQSPTVLNHKPDVDIKNLCSAYWPDATDGGQNEEGRCRPGVSGRWPSVVQEGYASLDLLVFRLHATHGGE